MEIEKFNCIVPLTEWHVVVDESPSIKDINDETVVHFVVQLWEAYFGCTSTITKSRERQLESGYSVV